MPTEPEKSSSFATTRWSMVLAAGQRSLPSSEKALASLCETYWYPLYAFMRRRGIDVERAQDLTQEFFARVLEKNILAGVQPEWGRFRAFLLTALKNFLVNEWERGQSQKRGGGKMALSLDFAAGEKRFCQEPSHTWTPERLFARQWALTLLEQVLAQLRQEFAKAGKEKHFDILKPFLAGDRTGISLADAGKELGLSEGAAKVAAHRLRKRYRELLREEVAETLADGEEVEEEIRWLFEVLGS
jgi:RNA polymerase sigma factor (sigma-70 family)